MPTSRVYRSIEEINQALNRLQIETEGRLQSIRTKIEKYEKQGLHSKKLWRELEDMQRYANITEASLRRKLAEAQENEKSEAEGKAQEQKHDQDERAAALKVLARREWMASGGNSDEFESAWPGLHEELMKKSVLSSVLKASMSGNTSGIDLDFESL